MSPRKTRAEAENPRVVIVEERNDDIYSIRFVLQSLGHSVESVAYDRTYLDRVAQMTPELVIVDMLIPARGGFHAVRDMRKVFKTMPIVAITADAMDGDEAELKKTGVSAVVKKPYSVPDLQKVLKRYLK